MSTGPPSIQGTLIPFVENGQLSDSDGSIWQLATDNWSLAVAAANALAVDAGSGSITGGECQKRGARRRLRTSLQPAKTAAGSHVHALWWEPGFIALLFWPSWALLALIGVALIWVGRKRHYTHVYSNY